MNMQAASTSFPSTYFTALITQEGQICAFEAVGQRVVGVSNAIYEEVKKQRDDAIAKAENLYKLCVEHGVITPEPTQEELLKQALNEIKRTQEINERLVSLLAEKEHATPATPASPTKERQTIGTSNRNGGEKKCQS